MLPAFSPHHGTNHTHSSANCVSDDAYKVTSPTDKPPPIRPCLAGCGDTYWQGVGGRGWRVRGSGAKEGEGVVNPTYLITHCHIANAHSYGNCRP